MIHSSAIIDGEKGRLFSGFSGVGKSTMAGIWQRQGYTVINDDRNLLSLQGDTVQVYNTPMFRADVPKHHELHAIYLLQQSKENYCMPLQGAQAVSRVLAFCIQHAYNKDFLLHHMNILYSVCSTLKVFELGFKPDVDIIEFIRQYDT